MPPAAALGRAGMKRMKEQGYSEAEVAAMLQERALSDEYKNVLLNVFRSHVPPTHAPSSASSQQPPPPARSQQPGASASTPTSNSPPITICTGAMQFVDVKTEDRNNMLRGNSRDFPLDLDSDTDVEAFQAHLFTNVTVQGTRAYVMSGLRQWLAIFETHGAPQYQELSKGRILRAN